MDYVNARTPTQRSVFGLSKPTFDFWGELAARCYVSREFVKDIAYRQAYSGDVDPWLAYFIKWESNDLMMEKMEAANGIRREA